MQIQRLNMDNSWLIQMNGLRLLIDPWLEGTEIDFFPWFNTQWHRTEPMKYESIPDYDYVLITQKYPDHFHKLTLSKLRPTKLIVPASIEKSVKKLLPEAEVILLSKKQTSFEKNGVRIQFYPSNRGIDPIYDAYCISDDKEALFLATHGYFMPKNVTLPDKSIKLLISPFNDFQLPFYLGGSISPGLKGLLHLNEKLSPQYIVATHDEDKHAKGLVIKVAKVQRIAASDLDKQDIFKDKILDINHYNAITI